LFGGAGGFMAALRIKGIPYSQNKVRGNLGSPVAWSDAVSEQTKNLPTVTGACVMKVTFFLPRENIPHDFPFGNDLDNLLKRFFDALNKAIFRDAPGRDSCVMKVEASKVIVDHREDAGAELEVTPA
jgi:Holliday junction resolvase RusA-like endonuclease